MDDGAWVNLVDHSRYDCACLLQDAAMQHCYNSCRDADLGETDVDCGNGCQRKCARNKLRDADKECASGQCLKGTDIKFGGAATAPTSGP
eukprot:m51a1_g10228 hypothetical protein (90) ;mRNA; r:141577-141846